METKTAYADAVERSRHQRQTLVYPYQMDGRYMAQLIIPRDMSVNEADRLCAFIRSLAVTPNGGGQRRDD